MKGYRKRAVVYPVLAKRQSRSGLMEQTLRVDMPNAATGITVTLRKATSGDVPGTTLATFLNPDLSSTGAKAFTARADTRLEADTTYFVVGGCMSAAILLWAGTIGLTAEGIRPERSSNAVRLLYRKEVANGISPAPFGLPRRRLYVASS